jgi:hypothetical protein
MTSLELAPTVPGVHRFIIGPTAISNAVERIRAEGRLDPTSVPEVIAGFAIIPSEADIDFAKWYVRWTTSKPEPEATGSSFPFCNRSGNLKG